MSQRIQLKRDTAANWTTANTVLRSGEVGLETNTLKAKFGNGTSGWNGLGYAFSGTAVGDMLKSDNLSGLADNAVARTNLGAAGGAGIANGMNTGDQTSIAGITGTKAQFNTAVSDGDFVFLDSTDTITNKTLTAPVIVGATNAQVGTTYTLGLTDQSKLITLTNASAIAVTIPTNASVAFPVGTQIDCSQDGAGKVTFSGAGVTINSLSSLKSIAGQYVGVTLKKTATDTWTIYGNLIA